MRNSTVDFLVFTKDAGDDSIEVRVQDGEVWLTQDGELAEKETRAKFTQVADNGKPINIIQDKNYQSDFDRLMAETAETKYPN
ncbi:hypothetical protein GPK87_16880 [Oscillibacter sp. MCC667]|nr:hypothetical protein [Oscillibacter sp. MCC667]